MRRIRLGRSELITSEIGFGGIPIQRLQATAAVTVVRQALDLGVTLIDSAYGYGHSEEYIGQAIKGRREGLILATKAPGRTAQAFTEQMEQSFRRLGVDHIDLYQFHNVSDKEAYQSIIASGGPLEIARAAQKAGRIGHIGITSHSMEIALKAVASGLYETLMFPFNFVTDEAQAELIPLCQQHDVGFIAMKPMAGGLLGNANLAFRWLGQYPNILPLIGIETPDEIREIVDLVDHPRPMTDTEQRDIALLRDELGKRFCRRCEYCMPCPQDINIPFVMNVKSFAKRMPQDRIFGAWGQSLVAAVENCAECGECESRCPYELPIREILRDNADWFRAQQATL